MIPIWQVISVLLVLIYHVQGKKSYHDILNGDGPVEEMSQELDTESDMVHAHGSHGDYIPNTYHMNHFPSEPKMKQNGMQLTMKPSRCYYYPDKGSCNHSYERFYYDPIFNVCKWFAYGGCGGNSNRFMTHLACMRTCSV